MNIQSKFVEVQNNVGDLTYFKIDNPFATALITNYGGHIIAFKPKSSKEEVLWSSQKSFFEKEKAIRGGIPICWPYFSVSDFANEPMHGFARINDWEVVEISDLENNETKLVLTFSGANLPKTYCQLNAQLEIIVGETLKVKLISQNCGETAFTLKEALHTYFNIGDINKIKITGLEGIKYLDKLKSSEEIQEGAITIDKEVDRIYKNTDNTIEIVDSSFERKIIIKKSGSLSAVVWNPWIEKSKNMVDFADEEYQQMVCVETANLLENACDIVKNEKHELNLEIGVANL